MILISNYKRHSRCNPDYYLDTRYITIKIIYIKKKKENTNNMINNQTFATIVDLWPPILIEIILVEE